ncbi:MAG: hypothetical protein Ct9H90mP3_2420 [Flammeovirgaceae bacterium]|nr:MAG: hypothetical protein Ct9H90mP3_2420 [Flammeovirgaceae bacterium]
MKIGAFVPQGWRMDLNDLTPNEEWNTILSSAKKIEDYGYESLWVYDHFHTFPLTKYSTNIRMLVIDGCSVSTNKFDQTWTDVYM